MLKLELEQRDQSAENRLQTQQDQLDQFKEAFERQKLLLLDATQNQDDRYSSLLKQHAELKAIIEVNSDEKKKLSEKINELEKDLDDSRRSIREKNQQINELEEQLETLHVDSDGWQVKYEQLKEEKGKCVDEMKLLISQITHLEKEKIELNQVGDSSLPHTSHSRCSSPLVRIFSISPKH